MPRRPPEYFESLPKFEQVTTAREFDKNGLTDDAKGALAYALEVLESSVAVADEIKVSGSPNLLVKLRAVLDSLGADDSYI